MLDYIYERPLIHDRVMDVLCVEFRGSDDPVDSLFLLDHDWVDIERGTVAGGEAGRVTAKPPEAEESKFVLYLTSRFRVQQSHNYRCMLFCVGCVVWQRFGNGSNK